MLPIGEVERGQLDILLIVDLQCCLSNSCVDGNLLECLWHSAAARGRQRVDWRKSSDFLSVHGHGRITERVATGFALTRSLHLQRPVPCGHCRAHSLRDNFPGPSHFLCPFPRRRGWEIPKQRWKDVDWESGQWSSPLMSVFASLKPLLPTPYPLVPCLTDPHPCRRIYHTPTLYVPRTPHINESKHPADHVRGSVNEVPVRLQTYYICKAL